MAKKIIIVVSLIVVVTVIVLVAMPWGNYESEIEKSEITDKVEFNNDEEAEPPSLDELTGDYVVDAGKGGTAELLFNTDGLKSTYGGFEDFDISFSIFDDYTTSELTVTIETASLNTKNEMRDEHLLEAEFFNAKKYPQIIFSSNSVVLGDTSYIAKGELEMNGVKKAFDVPFLHLGSGGSDLEVFEAFEGAFEIDRTKFGQEESTGVGNIVKVNFYCEMQIKGP